MTFDALIAVIGLSGLLLLIAAIRNTRTGRIAGGLSSGVAAMLLLSAAAGACFVAVNLRAFERLGNEQPAGELQFTRIGYHQFNGVFTSPSGERQDFALRGDEWQVDARVLKWQALANILGFDAAYRLDRIGGRYTAIDDERNLPRTVYALHEPEHIDLWAVVHRHAAWVPWVDALYGSAAFLPMADGALYEIRVSQSGLVARPLNQAARSAVGNWH